MKLEDIQSLWATESVVDRSDLGHAALDVPRLHHMFFKMLSTERLRYQQMQTELATLKQDRVDWLNGVISQEEMAEYGWHPYLKAKPLKTDITGILDGDPVIIPKVLSVALQKEKVDYLVSIIQSINFRNNMIKNAISWLEFSKAYG